MNGPRLAVALAVVLGMPLCASAGSDRADVALVLAIDVSGSVDDNRFRLQREGIAAALESEELAAAVPGGVNQMNEVAKQAQKNVGGTEVQPVADVEKRTSPREH